MCKNTVLKNHPVQEGGAFVCIRDYYSVCRLSTISCSFDIFMVGGPDLQKNKSSAFISLSTMPLYLFLLTP